jgi:hypothetical protein
LTADDVQAVENHRRYSAMSDEDLKAERVALLEVIEGKPGYASPAAQAN